MILGELKMCIVPCSWSLKVQMYDDDMLITNMDLVMHPSSHTLGTQAICITVVTSGPLSLLS